MFEHAREDAFLVTSLTYTWPGNAKPTLAIDELRLARGESLLLRGPSGSGKTTLLRDMAAELSSGRYGSPLVLVFDSFNEVGGDSLEPHRSLGLARRCQSADRWNQGPRMLDAVSVHRPDVFLVDELSTAEEAAAAAKAAEEEEEEDEEEDEDDEDDNEHDEL